MIGLSEKQINDMFTEFYNEFDSIPFCELNLSDAKRTFDGYNFIVKGDLFENIIGPFRYIQPLSFSYMSKGKFFYGVEKSDIPVMGDITQFGILINNIVYYIKYDPFSYKSGNKSMGGFHCYIPKEIMCSWLYVSQGWEIAEDTIHNIYKSNLPSLLLMPIHSIIEGFEDSHGVALPEYTTFLEQKFHHAFRQSYDDDKFNDEKYFELRCLLDTRSNDDWSKTGYQLFVSSHNDERNVYVIPRADVMGIKKLTNPAEAIDHYAAHLFSRAEGEFDFMQYAEDF